MNKTARLIDLLSRFLEFAEEVPGEMGVAFVYAAPIEDPENRSLTATELLTMGRSLGIAVKANQEGLLSMSMTKDMVALVLREIAWRQG